MKKSLIMACVACLLLAGGCDPRFGRSFGEFMAGSSDIERLGTCWDSFLIWKRGQLGMRCGDRWMTFKGDYTQARKVFQFYAYGIEYYVIECRETSGRITHLLGLINGRMMTGYNMNDPSTEPFESTASLATVLASSKTRCYLYQYDPALGKYRVWEVDGDILREPDYLASPPRLSAKPVSRKKNSGTSSRKGVSAKKRAKSEDDMPLADLPDLDD